MSEEVAKRILDGRSWSAFCRALEEAGQAVLRPETPNTAFDRAEGFRYLTRLLRAGLESQLEFSDPRRPGFYQLSNETLKIGNDNPDNIYWNASVSGRHEYRIRGTRGNARLLCFASKGGSYATDGTMQPTGELHERELVVDADGRYEILVSCKRQPGNWLPMRPETTSLVVRQTFDDRRRGRAGAASRSSASTRASSRPLDPAALEAALLRAVGFVRGTANLFVDWMRDFGAHVNQLPPNDQLDVSARRRRLQHLLLQQPLAPRARPGAADRAAPHPALRRLELPALELLDGVARLPPPAHPHQPAPGGARAGRPRAHRRGASRPRPALPQLADHGRAPRGRHAVPLDRRGRAPGGRRASCVSRSWQAWRSQARSEAQPSEVQRNDPARYGFKWRARYSAKSRASCASVMPNSASV